MDGCDDDGCCFDDLYHHRSSNKSFFTFLILLLFNNVFNYTDGVGGFDGVVTIACGRGDDGCFAKK